MDVGVSCECGIGCRGFVVEVDRYAIAWCKPSYSMGLILEAWGEVPRRKPKDGLSYFFTL